MTKKDYIMLARVIGESWAGDVNTLCPVRSLVWRLAHELQRDNPRFDKARFEEAVEKARVGA